MKLKSLIAAMAVLFVFSTFSFAQDERNKVEFYAGYSFLKTDTNFDEDFDTDQDLDFNGHGVNMSLTGNVSRYAGLKFDFSSHGKTKSFDDGIDSGTVKLRTNQFLGGVQFKDNRKEGSRVRPFAHLLVGVARQKLSASGTLTIPDAPTGGGTPIDFSGTTSDLAMVVGGGIDINVSKRVAIRLIQLDYNPVFVGDQDFDDFTIDGRRQNNFRIGFGIVIH